MKKSIRDIATVSWVEKLAKKIKFGPSSSRFVTAIEIDDISSEIFTLLLENEEKLNDLLEKEGDKQVNKYIHVAVKNHLKEVNQKLTTAATVPEQIRSRDSEEIKAAKRAAMNAHSIETMNLDDELGTDAMEPLQELLHMEREELFKRLSIKCPVLASTLPDSTSNLAANYPTQMRMAKIQQEMFAFLQQDTDLDNSDIRSVLKMIAEIFEGRHIRTKEAKQV